MSYSYLGKVADTPTSWLFDVSCDGLVSLVLYSAFCLYCRKRGQYPVLLITARSSLWVQVISVWLAQPVMFNIEGCENALISKGLIYL